MEVFGGFIFLPPSSYPSTDVCAFFPIEMDAPSLGKSSRHLLTIIYCLFSFSSNGLSTIRCLDLIPPKQTEINAEEHCQVKDLKFSQLPWFISHNIPDTSSSCCFFPSSIHAIEIWGILKAKFKPPWDVLEGLRKLLVHQNIYRKFVTAWPGLIGTMCKRQALQILLMLSNLSSTHL